MFLARVLPRTARASWFWKWKKLTGANFADPRRDPKTRTPVREWDLKKLTWANFLGRHNLWRKNEFQNYSCFLLDHVLKWKWRSFLCVEKMKIKKTLVSSFKAWYNEMGAIYGRKILARPPRKIKWQPGNSQTLHKWKLSLFPQTKCGENVNRKWVLIPVTRPARM